MIADLGYKKSFYFALGLHVLILVLLFVDTSSQHPALTMEAKNTPGIQQTLPVASQQEVVKAVSVDSKQVMETVNRLKQERLKQQQAEANRQKDLQRQAEAAKQQRIKEQQQIAKLREEANKIAIARKKQLEEEKKHLKELAEQKALEAKRIEELKKQNEKLAKQQALEAKKLAELNKKKVEEQLKAEEAKAVKEANAKAEKEAQAKADLESKRQAQAEADARQAELNAQKQAQLAGEVDKYKALIVNAIGRHWILPDNVDSSLSSQFRIRLAPDGMVLDVTLIRSSGDPLLDRSAQTAIKKASPLPVPTDAETFNMFRDISLTVRPEHVRG